MRKDALVKDRPETATECPHETEVDLRSDEVVPKIVNVIAALEDTSPSELPPLYHVFDPDGLERMLTSATDPFSIRFQYIDYLVEVSNTGDITVQTA